MSSNSFVEVVRPGGRLVVERAGFEASVQDADESVGELAQRGVVALSHSGLWRAVLAEAEDLAHLVEAIDGVVARLGGVTRQWRFDRMSTVCAPSGRLSAAFAQLAKHYAVAVEVCPPRHGNRKGVVEKANHGVAQRWWRTLGDDATPTQAQLLLDAEPNVRCPPADARRAADHGRGVGRRGGAGTETGRGLSS